ncbi:hypothetical protein ABBQ38_013341 [Trebouxia sp. C0009 RCD-2024]
MRLRVNDVESRLIQTCSSKNGIRLSWLTQRQAAQAFDCLDVLFTHELVCSQRKADLLYLMKILGDMQPAHRMSTQAEKNL